MADVPTKQRIGREGIKCEFCGRPASSNEALETHQITLHFRALKEKKKLAAASKRKFKVQKPERKQISKKIALGKTLEGRSSKEVKPEFIAVNSNDMDNLVVKNGSMKKKAQAQSTIEYKCPKCVKTFKIRFIAIKHIQKHHCVNSKDEKVPKDSPDIVKPILLELCQLCKVKVPVPHNCPLQAKSPMGVCYKCSKCQQKFKSTLLFTKHIENEHQDQIQKMDFPSDDEFQTWKKQMEVQTECSYVIMQKVNKKRIYFCSELMEFELDGTAKFCPSIIITTHNKNLNVKFYPNHSGHKYKKYSIENYKLLMSSNSKDSLIEVIEILDSEDEDEDLHIKFKTLIKKIEFDAAKINISSLKKLINKANEMNVIISKYSEDDDISMGSFPSSLPINMTQGDDDTDNEPLINRKRSSEVNGLSAKNKKGPVRRSETFSLANNKKVDKIMKALDKPNKTTVSRKELNSPSFNDSYKEFIDKNKLASAKSKTRSSANKNSQPIANNNNKTTKKQVVKTKIGIIKPSSSPKKIDRRSLSIPKDIEYEVREQENDCNILILKI